MPDVRRFAPDITYSEWHRPASIGRFLSQREAQSLVYIDIDWMEVCPSCYKTLLLVETVRDVGQERKVGRVLEELARDSGKPAAVVFYKVSESMSFRTSMGTFPDIESFRVRRVWPPPEMEAVYTPERWALKLLHLRRQHQQNESGDCDRRRQSAFDAAR